MRRPASTQSRIEVDPGNALPEETFAERLDAWAERAPESIALIDDDAPVTISALRDCVMRLAGAMVQAGVRPEDRVAIWLPNGMEWVVGFLACARIGTLTLAVNTRFRARELADVLGRGRADWLLYWPGFKDIDFDAILRNVPEDILRHLRGVFVAGPPQDKMRPLGGQQADLSARRGGVFLAGPPQDKMRPFGGQQADLSARRGGVSLAAPPQDKNRPAGGPAGIPAHSLHAMMADGPPLAVPAGNGPAISFTTSGTTSLPKFVVHDQLTLLRHGDAVARAYGHRDTARILAVAPFCGVFGFAALVGGLAPGVPVVCQAVFDARRAADAVPRHRITHAYLNNEALHRVLEAAPNNDYTSVRLFGFATFAPGLQELPARAARHGITLTALYGSSELIALVAAQPLDDAAHRYLPGGRLIYPGARVRARDPADGVIVPAGQLGEIEIRSPSLMLGYLDDADSTRRAMTDDGYFRTGDLGYAVDERQFVFQARMGDSLRLAGFLVNPAEIEAFVAGLPGIRACQVVAAESGGKTVPYAFVLLDEGTAPDPDAWRTACQQAMAAFKVPAGFHAMQAFPVVESANSIKIQKNRLRELAAELLRAASPPR